MRGDEPSAILCVRRSGTADAGRHGCSPEVCHCLQEETLRARIPAEFTRRRRPWKSFRPDRWYPAEWENGEGSDIVLRDGRTTAMWPRTEVEIRAVPDDEWEIRSTSRLDVPMEGQTLQVPGRVAECPEGHARTIPTRFDAEEVVLKCVPCRRAYRLVARSS